MKAIDFKNYVAKDAVFFATCQIKWFGICLTRYEKVFIVTTISLLGNSVSSKGFTNKRDAYAEFSRLVSLLSE